MVSLAIVPKDYRKHDTTEISARSNEARYHT